MSGAAASGLCPTCVWSRLVTTERSVFTLCTRGLQDPAFPKYPRLPVVRCRGYDAIADGTDRDEPD